MQSLWVLGPRQMNLGGHTHSDRNNTLCPWPEAELSSDETAQLLISEQHGKKDPTMESLGGGTDAHRWWQHHPEDAGLQVPGDPDGVTCSA